MKRRTQEEMFDLMLRDAFREDLQNDEPELSAREEPPVSFSPEFEGKMAKLIRKSRRAEWWQRNRGRVQRTAAMFAVVIMVGCLLVTKVDAFRVPFLELVYTVREEFTSFDIVDHEEQGPVSESIEDFVPTYVPDGFHIKSVDEDENSFFISFIDEKDDYYSIDFYRSARSSAIDTEDATMEELEIIGYPGFVVKKDGDITVVWYPENSQYIIGGTISENEIYSILGSIKKFS